MSEKFQVKRVPSLVQCLLIMMILSGCGAKDDDTKTSSSNPLSTDQWHLENKGTSGMTMGEDINVKSVWDSNIKGRDVIIALIDDGLETSHEDLSANISTSVLGYNFVTGSTNPSYPGSTHGTAVGGLISARDDNYLGVAGVAPRSKLVGFNLIIRPELVVQDSVVGQTLMRSNADIHVYNNSWGFSDGYGHYETGTGNEWSDGIDTGLASGRGGKGAIYVWAGGNGGAQSIDNSNYDGYANYHGVIAVAAVGPSGKKSFYSEDGANLLVAAPSSGYVGSNYVGVTTTDLTGNYGYNSSSSYGNLGNKNYTNSFGGTSAAAPIVSGVVALMLEKNPNLGYRDVRYILATTARKNDIYDSGWKGNGAGYSIHHSYGFGVVDAKEAVEEASGWTNLGNLITYQAPVAGVQNVGTAIADNPTPEAATSSTISVSGSGISRIEFVEIIFNSDHTNWGNLTIKLKRTGAYSTSAILAETHTCINKATGSSSTCSVTGTNTWRFGATFFLGEPADGDWVLEVYDKKAGTTGNFTSWRLKFYGS